MCTEDGRPLSNRLEAAIPGGGEIQEVSVAAVAPRVSEAEKVEFQLTRTGSFAERAERLDVRIRLSRSDSSDDIHPATVFPGRR